MVASLGGNSRIRNPLMCDDTRATIATWRKLGAVITREGNLLAIRGCRGVPRVPGGALDVGESGTLLRFVLSILPLATGQITVNGRGTIMGRTNKQVLDALRSWGVNVAGRGRDDCLPIVVDGCGRLAGGSATVDGNVTSQVVSSLLIAAPFAERDTTLRLDCRLVSRPYVDVTLDVLRWAGVSVERSGYKRFTVRRDQQLKPRGTYVVHGDYSSAAFLLAAGALTSSSIEVHDVVDDCQGDKRIIRILRGMGARIRHEDGVARIAGASRLHGLDIDGSDIPDLVPILCVLGSFASGTTRIRNIAHLAHKESNRLATPAGELKKLGARITVSKDSLVIRHSPLHGGTVSACKDHRIAMALTVAGIAMGGGVTVKGAESISKSYPGFTKDMKRLGADLSVRS
jgi:3-phosphoshikimate 1-carboxyvinyltransferase